MVYDFLLVSIQIFIGLIFVVINQTSEFVSIILSFIASYSIISFSIVTVIILLYPIKGFHLKANVNSFISDSKNLYVVGIANGVVDRIDKLAIGIFLPLEVLGKYALTTGVLTFGRFLPEAIAKTMFFRRDDSVDQFSKLGTSKKGIFLLGGAMFLSICTVEMIVFLFGKEWDLPFTFTLAFMTQELVRAFYQLNISGLMLAKRDEIVVRCAKYLLILSIAFVPVFTIFLGIFGPSIALIIIYLSMILYVKFTDFRGCQN